MLKIFPALAAAALLVPSLAHAQTGQARVITRPDLTTAADTTLPPRFVGQPRHSIPLSGPGKYTYQVIAPPIAAPAAVVTREIAEQPVYQHLVEFRINNTTVLIDPKKDYIHKPWGGMDENLSIARAARIARSITAMRSRIIRSSAPNASRAVPARFSKPRPAATPVRDIPQVPAKPAKQDPSSMV